MQSFRQCFSRFQTRERYNIHGSPFEDVLIGELTPRLKPLMLSLADSG